MTVGQFKAASRGYQERLEREARLQDQLNHTLGRYVAIGVNDPKKYPKQPLLSKEEKKATKYTSDEAYERIARIKYGKKK